MTAISSSVMFDYDLNNVETISIGDVLQAFDEEVEVNCDSDSE